MKRMYVILGLIVFVMLATVGALSQILTSGDVTTTTTREPFDRQKRRMELREEMHRRMRDKLLNGVGSDEDLFKDMEAEFNQALPEVSTQSNFTSEWTETPSGRVLVLTPQSKEQKLNIDVNEALITIKGESIQKTATSSISSSFSNSFSVPQDCDGKRVKMSEKDGKLLVELPFRSPVKETRKPLGPSRGAVGI